MPAHAESNATPVMPPGRERGEQASLPFAARGLSAGTLPGYRQLVPPLINMREETHGFRE
jgi:hypothetical protein